MSKPVHAVVLGTAGHIDHGKTTLVRALTGIDTDRLPEEKKRGITIELGFAPWRIGPGVDASIVDVPGHEGFVRTMIAGAAGIDAVILVVSAEDGVMPQTREHINVCRLLGVRAGVVALTKIDRIGDDPDARELAVDDVRSALADTPFAAVPIVGVSAVTGAGLDELRARVLEVIATIPARDASGVPVLPLDRVFTIKGHGTVVTGTLVAGSVAVRDDEQLELVPVGERARRSLRARAAQVRLEARERVSAGNRVALNLAGIDREEIERGDVLTRGPLVATRSIVHAALHHLPGHSAAWVAGTQVQLGIGTAHAVATLDPLELYATSDAGGHALAGASGDDVAIAAGREGLVRLRLQPALPVWHGARVVLRGFDEPRGDHSGRTIGGGTLVDPAPPTGRAQRGRWIAIGRALAGADADARITALLDEAGPRGLGLDEVVHRTGLASAAELLARRTGNRGDVVDLGGTFVHASTLRPLTDAAVTLVDRHHAQFPMQPGIGRAVLEHMLGSRVAAVVASAAIDRALARGVLRAVDDQGMLARPGKGLSGTSELPGHAQKILDRYVAGGITPPTLREVGDDTGLSARDVLDIVTALQRTGRLVKISADLSLDRSTHAGVLAQIRGHLQAAGSIDVQALKQLTGLSRKFAVPLLEHCDQLQITLRRGDTRIAGPKA